MPVGKGPLRIAIEDFIEGFKAGDKVKGWLKSWLENLELEAIETFSDLTTALGIQSKLPAQLQPVALRALVKHQIGLAVLLVPLLWEVVNRFADFVTTPALRPLQRVAEGILKTRHPDIGTLAQMKRKYPEGNFNYTILMSEEGYAPEYQKAFDRLTQQFLSPNDYEHLRLRGAMTDADLEARLKVLGYEDHEIKGLAELRQVIPPVNDLITMQVREAFNDTFAAQFHYDEGDTTQVTAWAAKQGLSADWVKRYWRAHWQLPGPSQVFEMFQRLRPGKSKTPVTFQDVQNYLQVADYAPFWRSRLTEIAYNPITRVDVRRMYKTGHLNEAQVKDAYLDLGYKDADAQALTAFTIAYEAEEETGIVRGSVLSAYGDGQIDRSTAETMLKGGGYDNTTIAFYLDNVDFKESLEIQNIKLNNIKKRFIEGLIDESTVNAEIGKLNLPSERTQALFELWLTERENQIALPTLTQIENFYELGISTLEDFTRILKRRGYSEETIQWNIQRIDIEKSDKAAKEAERAQADMERLDKSKLSSAYQKAKAKKDLDIAQARAEITDIDIALHTKLSSDDLLNIKKRQDLLRLDIQNLQASIAELKAEDTSLLIELPSLTVQSDLDAVTLRRSEIKQEIVDMNVIIQQNEADITLLENTLHGALSDDDILTLNTRKSTLKGVIAQLQVAKAQLRFDNEKAIQ